jgi:hypothetical protein
MSRYPLIITIAVVLTCLGGEAFARRVSEQTVLNACGTSLKVLRTGARVAYVACDWGFRPDALITTAPRVGFAAKT